MNRGKYIWQCVNCGRQYQPGEISYLCPACASKNTKGQPPQGVLKTLYDYQELKSKLKRQDMIKQLWETQFLDILPIRTLGSLSGLRVGKTPLYRYKQKNRGLPIHELLIKDDSQNPTYSYKDRASDLVSAVAKERDIKQIMAASTGNAGSSLAGIGAAQGQQIIILVPESSPQAKLLQILMYGADIIPVCGSYDDAFDLSAEASEKLGIYNRNTAYNPFTIEGKKTAALEMYYQMDSKLPDRVFVPVGDGCILAGIYKGFEDLLELGIIEQIPQIVAVQAKGSSNLVNNVRKESFVADEPDTLADSISVKIPRNYYLAKDYLLKYGGETISVSDREILVSARQLAGRYGLFSEPASAAAFAGYQKYLNEDKIEEHSTNLVQLTGSGLKDIKPYLKEIKLPEAIKPELPELVRRLKHEI